MSARRVLVTGAGGMVGSAVCRLLRSRGLDVIAAGRQPSFDIQWELGRPLGEALAGVDTVIHLAARVHVRGRGFADSGAFDADNVNATVKLAGEARERGVRRFVFMSSIGVLGSASDVPLREDTIGHPLNAYTRSKHFAELGVRRMPGLETVILRAPAVIGAGARGNVMSIINAVRRGVPLPFASIANQRQFVSLANLAEAVLHCVETDRAAGETFHVANPERWSTPRLCELAADALGRNVRLWPFPPALLRAGLIAARRRSLADGLTGDLLIDTGKIHAMLGWQPRADLREALREAVTAA